MKKLLLVIGIILALASCTKTEKIGYYNSQEVLQDNPAVRQADSTLRIYVQSLEKGYNDAKEDYNRKLANYKKDSATMPESARSIVTKDLAALQNQVETYSQNANTQLTQVQNEVYKPITDKLNKIVEDIAKSQGFSYVFEVNNVRFAYSKKEYNLTELVKKKFSE